MRSDSSSIFDGRSGLSELFAIVADLAEGELTFPPPFDLSSSVALADNEDYGDLALKMFDASARLTYGYHVAITAVGPVRTGNSPARTILDTTVPSTRLLFALLGGLMDELEARHIH